MRIEVTLQLGLCALCLTLALLGKGKGQTLTDPTPIQCSWGRWTEWTQCDPCTKTRRRSRSPESFGQFGGEACVQPVGESEHCTTSATCVNPPPPVCEDKQFLCQTSGTCIGQRLKCNGDPDCEDYSDEECDEIGRRPCDPLELQNNEQGRTAGYGINILGGDPRMNPFYNDFFNGMCQRVRNPTTRQYDRIPWNVGVLNYQTLVEETVSRELYESSDSLVREMMEEMTNTFSVGLSFKFTPTEKTMAKMKSKMNWKSETNLTSAGVDGSLEFSKKEILKTMTEKTNIKNRSYMRVKGKVQLSTYRMRSRGLVLNKDFLADVQFLPLEYEKGIYYSFLEDYGTHYTRNGRSGGEYELIYVLNQDTIREKNMTQREVQNCVKVGISANVVTTSVVDVSPNLSNNHCTTLNPTTTGNKEGKAAVDQVMTAVKGGSLAGAVAMKAELKVSGVLDIATFKEWAMSIGEEPALIHSEPEPIYTLVPLTSQDANTRVMNMKRAISDYVADYSVCKCKPCQNGGTVALMDGKCICMCLQMFEGMACQNLKTDKSDQTHRRPTVYPQGNWACWSSWSSCSGQQRTRTRSCNTEGVPGATCSGDASSDEPC